jgi:murein DD-endopeptidase MepM/ murein hydrolase activator NlpD
MDETEATIAALGNEPPLSADGRSGPPDKREVSARWLSGTFLTGVTSSILMGVALLAALDGREQLATPPEIMKLTAAADQGEAGEEAKDDRLAAPRQVARAKDRRRMEVPTTTKVGDHEIVRNMPFVEIKMALAAGHKTTRKYPPFDPFAIASEDGETQQAAAAAEAATSITLDAKGESDMAIKTIDFPMQAVSFDANSELSADEVEEVVRSTASVLTDGAVQVASLHYVDPQRFGATDGGPTIALPKVIQENVSVAQRAAAADQEGTAYAEDIIPFTEDRNIKDAFAQAGYDGKDAVEMAEAIAKLLSSDALAAGTVLRVGLLVHGDTPTVVRTSVYHRTDHVLTIARDDHDQLVPGEPPEPSPEIATAFDDTPPIVRTRSDLPTVYDGIYQTAFSYGMSAEMTKKMIRLLASDVDFQARLNPADRLEVFFSQPDGDDQMSDESDLLFVSATFSGTTRNFYRFQSADGGVDYFDEEGRSAKQFLLRTPVPNGQFRSGFGMRTHPILGYVKMHTGVDWAAPTGTPILAAGSGVVEKAGWAGGYGRQTIIRHPNGYETSYNHQSAIADWVKPGAKVRQGQVIGYVGASGLATGAHLHYELIVNGTKVDPMRVRLPNGKVLKGDDLVAFKAERDRIDTLLKEEDSSSLNVASVKLTN